MDDGFSFVADLGALAPGDMSEHARIDALAQFVEALVHVNRLWLPFHPEVPPLYSSGVIFAAEPLGSPNYWRDIPATLALGQGHCVALTAWRIAELREAGESAQVQIDEWHPAPGQVDWHVYVLRANGQTEDPARILGMP